MIFLFLVVTINDGGADADKYTRNEVSALLHSNPKYWGKAAKKFDAQFWVPGDMMEWPMGWIVCLRERDPTPC